MQFASRTLSRSNPITALLAAGPFLLASHAVGQAIPVSVQKTEQGWQLLRGGKPYLVKGAGGDHSLAELAKAGANSIRTWDAENVRGEDLGVLLDEAHDLGLTVAVGIWLGHERHGFDYSDPEQVAKQLERSLAFVRRYKDHPAVLLWGIGNEMEGFDEGDNPAIWKAVNEIAEQAKEIDPLHPTMTVTTFVHGERIEYVHRRCPAIDIHGVNAYGAATIIKERLLEGKATKPYILTEYGPPGPWETELTSWGVPYEPSSGDKATSYKESYESITSGAAISLGSYAFVWGDKMEATPTWFGMWLADGSRLAAVDTLTELWSGQARDNLAPIIERLTFDGGNEWLPDQVVTAQAQINDPEDDRLTARWELVSDSGDILTGGDYRPPPRPVANAIGVADPETARVTMPKAPGAYRLYYFLYDGQGGAATANIPLRVLGEPRIHLPVALYTDDSATSPWAPSGWMGNVDKLTFDLGSTEQVFAGKHSIRMRYEGVFGWVGVAWQNPPNNWGDIEGGHNVSGASALELMVRGQYGGEKASFGVGLLDDSATFPDSSITKTDDIVLTREWQRIEIDLRGKNLASLKTGFFVTLAGRQTPVTIYLDNIRFIR